VIWLGLAACLAWAVLLLGRGLFWLARDDDRDAATLPVPDPWPGVVCVVPARDEAASIAATVGAVLAQDYPGALRLIVVDDRSTDGTAALALAAGRGDGRLTVLTGAARPAGWTGKLWALQQGVGAAGAPDYLWFTDADIHHAPDSLRRLVARAVADQRVMVSLMARLNCESAAERWLIPAFIFFFQMLYPFRWSNRPSARTAAAAGGCVVLQRLAFERAGGLAPIRGALIDDCSLAALMKRQGAIWLGLTERVTSLRPYPGVAPIRRMVARTAFAQLRFSAALLLGMLGALALVFLAPPLLALFAPAPAAWLGGLAWLAMILAYAPTLRRFRLHPLRAAALPVIALIYMGFTCESAWQEWRGRGGMWKGEAGPRADRGGSATAGQG
jgi:hopene-associated glycosyltransferase HpnB